MCLTWQIGIINLPKIALDDKFSFVESFVDTNLTEKWARGVTSATSGPNLIFTSKTKKWRAFLVGWRWNSWVTILLVFCWPVSNKNLTLCGDVISLGFSPLLFSCTRYWFQKIKLSSLVYSSVKKAPIIFKLLDNRIKVLVAALQVFESS